MDSFLPVAVIDIGSNSIKVLVAQRGADGFLKSLKYKTLDVRISRGINRAQPVLSEDALARGVAAIEELIADARVFSPAQIALVATSAVRDALNGPVFAARVLASTGLPVRILSGDEEANLIGRGLTCDPALASLQDFYVLDLGGGSLEVLAFRGRKIEQELSLKLGCVRLTEHFVKDPEAPIPEATLREIQAFTVAEFDRSGFAFALPPAAPVVGTGGTVTTARTILAARTGKSLADSDTFVTVDELRELLATTARCCLEDRKRLPGMPAARADVFPTALATLIALADRAHVHSFQNSLYNLRWGVADSLTQPA